MDETVTDATREFAAGGYRYIPAVFQYSAGVAALPGYEIRRQQFNTPIPLQEGFERIKKVLTAADRPLTAFCACELRSPRPLTSAGFKAFNRYYVDTLVNWGLYGGGNDNNPVARSNVCPQFEPPSEPCLYAFAYTARAQKPRATCVISGASEARTEDLPYEQNTVRFGETSVDAMREKTAFVMAEVRRRLMALGFGWPDVTATQVYTIYDFHPFCLEEIVKRGAAKHGLTWHFCRPPVDALAFEIDCRSISLEEISEA
jgi:hypothetical protein